MHNIYLLLDARTRLAIVAIGNFALDGAQSVVLQTKYADNKKLKFSLKVQHVCRISTQNND